jgi:hypothetical protein
MRTIAISTTSPKRLNNTKKPLYVVFNGVEYIPGHEQQSLLLTDGLIKTEGKDIRVGNPIYKKRFTKTFFREVAEQTDASSMRYYLPDRRLNMERILADFERYIARIGVAAFYSTKNPMEATGKFQLTAWLYQFVSEESNELYFESRTGLGIMDIMLVYKKNQVPRRNQDQPIPSIDRRSVGTIGGKVSIA